MTNLVVTRQGLALVFQEEGEEKPKVVAQYTATQLVHELGALGLLLWAGLNQLRDIHAQLKQLNERAEGAVRDDGMAQTLDAIVPLLEGVPQLQPLLAQLRKRTG